MPTLKQISCSIELGPSQTKLKEYRHRYTDGGIEVYTAVPETNIPFSIHVTSSGYIAGGLAVLVFIDGNYQCNRNRNRLKLPASSSDPRQQQIDFQLRQKEDNVTKKGYIGRDWKFAKLRKINPNEVPPINSRFVKEVGTIEVIVLRCQDLDSGFAFTAMAPPGPMFETFSKPLPEQRQEQTSDDNSTTKVASKAPFKAPSKAPSKAASAKKVSEAGEDMMGGMFGLFDGAGDAPGYRRWTPGSYPVEPRYARRRNGRPTLYASRNDLDAGPYTVHGGYGRIEHAPISRARPQSLIDHYDSLRRPARGYETPHRPNMVAEPMPMSPQSLPAHVYARQAASRASSTPRDRSANISDFLMELAEEMESVFKLRYVERAKLYDLRTQAEACKYDPEMHFAALKLLKAKEPEVEKLDADMEGLMHSTMARMQRMDPEARRRAYEFIVVERRLIPANHPGLQDWQNSKAGSRKGSSKAASEADWQELGEFQKKGDGWEKKSLKAGSQKQEKPKSDGWGGNQQQNDGWGAGNDSQKQPSNNGLGGGDDQQDNAGDGWDNKPASKPASANQGWGNDNASNKSKHKTNQDNGWGDNAKSQKNDAWGNNDQQNDNDNWGGARDETKSQSHASKVRGWNDGSKKNDGGGGWGARSNGGEKKSQAAEGWGAAPAGKAATVGTNRHSATGTSTQLEPVIKPYWADGGKSDESKGKPRKLKRDPYQYPAPPAPVLPSDTRTEPGIDYAVHIGKGAEYVQQVYVPEYLDTPAKPYAVFKFYYRSQAAIEKMINRKIDTTDFKLAVKEAEKDKLMHTPKDEVVDEMMRLKLAAAAAGGKVSQNPSHPASKSATANDWGQKAASAKVASNNNDWNKAPSRSASKKDDWNKAPSTSASKKDDWGGGDAWGADDKKSQQQASNAGWGAADNNNNDNGWDKKSATKKFQGWGDQKQKSTSNATPQHFGEGDNLQKTKSQKSVPRDEGWGEAGW